MFGDDYQLIALANVQGEVMIAAFLLGRFDALDFMKRHVETELAHMGVAVAGGHPRNHVVGHKHGLEQGDDFSLLWQRGDFGAAVRNQAIDLGTHTGTAVIDARLN